MDALGRRFIINEQNELEERDWAPPPLGTAWGLAEDLELCEMSDPHRFLIGHLAILQKLDQMGLISERFHEIWPNRNEIWPEMNAVRFALRRRSNGPPVEAQMDWKEAWHGSSLESIPKVAKEGLKSREGGCIFVTPSWSYAFLLYSFDNVIPGQHERLRLVFQVRVRPGFYESQGDPYNFFNQEDFEGNVDANNMEWKVQNPKDVQVVGLVVKQLCPNEAFKAHDTYSGHLRESLGHV